MSFAFKKFNFFQQHEVKIHGCPANSTCHCLGGSLLYVGCDNGTVHLLDEAFQSQGSLSAYGHKVLFIAWAPARQLLVTVGLEEPGISTATLKVWEAERVATAAATAAAASSAAAAISALPQPAAASAAAASLPPLRLHKLFSSKHPESEVTALAVADDGSAAGHLLLVAVGLAAGAVHVFSGDVSSQKGKLTHTGKLQVRPDSGELWKVNALVFAAPQQQQQQQQGRNGASNKDPAAAAGGSSSKIAALGRSTPAASGGGACESSSSSSSSQQATPGQQWLYVVTEAQTLVFNMADMSKTILDQQGLLASGCAVLQEGLLVVARDDALYEYTPETRAGCTAFEGLKQGLAKLRRYLVVTTDDTSPDGAASSQLHLLDVRNKLLAGSFGLQGLAAVVVGPGGLATWDKAGRLVRYFEVELSTQLEVLFKRSLHKLALDLALCHDADPQLIAAIRQRWGDHLYAKAEYEGAMAQYLETIGSDLEPSYVIRRFLDAQRIHSLTRYLEQLHAAGLGTADHTTLLLNCYTKLKDVGKLDAFLHRNAGSSSSSSRGPAGGVGGGAAGMAVLAAAEKAARRHGKGGKGEGPQLSFDPETAFKVLRSAGYAQHALFVAEQAAQPQWILDVLLEDMGSFPEALAFIGMLSRRQQAQALQRYGKLLIGAAPDDTTALLMALCMPGPESQADHTGDSADAKADAKFVASVADYAQLYADRPTRLLYLCEFILFNSGEGEVPQEQQLYHTLLELYLAEQLVDHELQEAAAGSAAEVAPQARRDKARELLQRGWQPHMAQPKYDPEHALVLCRQHSYVPGLVLLYDKKRLYREVAALHMQAGDYGSLIAACVQYGDAAAGGDPQLWAEALEFFCSQPGDCSSAISQVLQHIEQGELLPPLVVLQTLAKNKNLKVSIVKDYVARQLQMEGKEIAKDRDTISRLQVETSAMKAEAAKLKSQPHVFQSSRCAASGQALELPVVHFMCGHSFNLRSLGESDRECPLCAPDFRRVLDIRRNMKAGALKPDEFFSQLDASADGFGVVAEHFGRGVMNMTQQSMASQGAAAGAGAGALGQL